MKPSIQIESIWEDETLFEVRIKANNGRFAGESCCYTTREEMLELSKLISGFPKSIADEVAFSTYGNDNHSYFSINLFCVDGLGHVMVRIKIADIIINTSGRNINNIVEFDLALESAAIDVLSKSLAELAKSGIGEVKAQTEET